jgi:hypothetical protein
VLSFLGYKRNANQTTLRFQLTLVTMVIIKTQTTRNVGKDVVKPEPLYTVGGNVK